MKKTVIGLVVIVFIFSSCISNRRLAGSYVFSGSFSYTKITLKKEGTYFQIRNFEGCKRYFYGTYERRGKIISFSTPNNKADLMYQEDYIITGYDKYVKEKRLYVLYQGDPYEDSIKVEFSDGRKLYTDNTDGFVVLPEDYSNDSISISTHWGSTKILLKKEEQNNLYFFVFNDKHGLIGCWDWLFLNRVRIKNGNLSAIRKNKGKYTIYKKVPE